MAINKVIMQQVQTDGSYNELLPKADAWTKDETLSAQVASVLGLRDNYKPDDAFLGLYFGVGTYRYRVRVVLKDGTPVQGSTISGIQAIQGQSLVTNEQGYVLGKSTSKSVTVSCTSPFADQKAPSGLNIKSSGIVTDVVITLLCNTDILSFSSTKNIEISSLVKTFDICGIGAGGGGGGSGTSSNIYVPFSAAGGGGRGYINQVFNEIASKRKMQIVIGAGGTGGQKVTDSSGPDGYSGGKRGDTTLSLNNQIVFTATGGNGGGGGRLGTSEYIEVHGRTGRTGRTSGGRGGSSGYSASNVSESAMRGGNGGVSGQYIFNETSLGLIGGGGGGGGEGRTYSTGYPGERSKFGRGGNPNGGIGRSKTSANSGGIGAGGGGGSPLTFSSRNDFIGSGASGGSGFLCLRFHF